MGQPYEGRHRMHDHRRRDGGEIARQASLGLEALAEGRAAQEIGEARRDAAADEHAAPRAQRQGDIARNAAQEGAEQLEGLAAHLAIVGERMSDDLAAVALRHGLAVDPGDGMIELHQARSGEDPLDRDVMELLAQRQDDGVLAPVLARQRGVAALGDQGDLGIAGERHGRQPEAAAGAHHGHRSALADAWRAERDDVFGPQGRQGPGKRLEIVQHLDVGHAQPLGDAVRIDDPGGIGKGDPAVLDRTRRRDERLLRGMSGGRPRQEVPRRLDRRGIVGDGIGLGHGEVGAVQQREAGVGGADIGNQGGGGCRHELRPHCLQ